MNKIKIRKKNKFKIINNNFKINKKLIFYLNNNHFSRFIVFIFLIFFLVLYLFIGAICTHWLNKPYIFVANYFYIIINCFILFLINYEIWQLNNNLNTPIYIKIIMYIWIIFLYLLPVENVSFSQGGYMPINYEFYTSFKWGWLNSWLVFIIYLLFFLTYIILWLIFQKNNLTKMFIIFIFIIYIIFAFKAITKFMLNNFYGWSSVVWLFLISIISDTFAFIGGINFGKHKLSVKISPNKTWEGLIIGIIVSTVIAIFYSILMFKYVDKSLITHNTRMWVFDFFSKNSIRYFVYIILSLILSCFSQLGDLLFSIIKRYFKIKNFSNIFFDHGGLLDRLDSILLICIIMQIISNLILL